MEQFTSILLMLVVTAFSMNSSSMNSRENNHHTAATLTPIAVSGSAATTKASIGFEKLKTLVGEWQGKSSEGQTGTVSYQLISGGTALIETLKHEKGADMVTIYHRNGDKLMMTHYCSMGNQPRMQATVPSGEIKNLNFVFVDGTNLSKHAEGHIHSLTLIFHDKDHFTQEWKWQEGGKESRLTNTFTRKN